MDPSNIQESKLATVHEIFVGDVSLIKSAVNVQIGNISKRILVTAIRQFIWYPLNLNLEEQWRMLTKMDAR